MLKLGALREQVLNSLTEQLANGTNMEALSFRATDTDVAGSHNRSPMLANEVDKYAASNSNLEELSDEDVEPSPH